MIEPNNLTPQEAGLITSLITNFALGLKLFVDWRSSAATRRDAAEVKAYEQLESLLKLVQEQLNKKDLANREKEDEIEQLERCLDDIKEKAKRARLDLMDLKQSVKNIRRFLSEMKIDDDAILKTIDELDRQLSEIGDCLK